MPWRLELLQKSLGLIRVNKARKMSRKKKAGLFYLIWSDFEKRAEVEQKRFTAYYLLTLLFNQPMLCVFLYRISHAFYKHRLLFFARLLASFNSYICKIFIDPSVDIGERFSVTHPFCIVIQRSAVIGSNVIICQGTDIGIGHGKNINFSGGVAIGDNTMIFSGVKIYANTVIGNNVQIGVNSVVLDSIPDNALAVGAPARVVRINQNNKI